MNPTRPVLTNIDRLNDYMDRNKLEAIIARSGQNFTYLSGIAYPGTLARFMDLTDSLRACILFWPRHGEPIAILNRAGEKLTLRDSWLRNVDVYEAYTESPYDHLCAILKREGLNAARVGFEKNFVSAAHWEQIQHALPQLHMIDIVQMMDEVRWVKTSGEIEELRKGADLLDEAFLEVFPTVRPGDTERDVHSRLVYACMKRGAGWAHGLLNSSRNTISYGGEGDFAFAAGDMIRTDYLAFLHSGYPGHQSRNAVIGKPSVQQQRDYDITLDVYLKVMKRCVPGTHVGELFKFTAAEFKKHGWDYRSGSGLMGHGVGAWWHQQEPILFPGSNTVLEEGMVLALEPHPIMYIHIQDMVVVRKGGPELLSPKFATDKMFVIE
jgi:Xaa-Pro aminopeptidase